LKQDVIFIRLFHITLEITRKIYTALKELQKSVQEIKQEQKLMKEDISKIKGSVLSKGNDKELIEV
jgi:hypothetical protein